MTNKLDLPKQEKLFYTTGELARICQLSSTTIFRAVTQNRLHAATTPGGHFRITKEEAEDFLRKNNIPLPILKETKNILIVEDNPVEARMYSRALKKDSRFRIEVTGSGYKAGFLTRTFQPDLILLDILLPDIDGREVAKLVRSDPTLKHIKIVAITGSREKNLIKDIQSWGFDAYIEKPVSPEKLNEKLGQLLK
ncbi:hypothetical protein BVX98_01645 [bacterium F11]|nr:hypothetical protein BVX98_01645 [bacterium F11]